MSQLRKKIIDLELESNNKAVEFMDINLLVSDLTKKIEDQRSKLNEKEEIQSSLKFYAENLNELKNEKINYLKLNEENLNMIMNENLSLIDNIIGNTHKINSLEIRLNELVKINEGSNKIEIKLEKNSLNDKLAACEMLVCSTEDLETKIDIMASQVNLKIDEPDRKRKS